MGDLFDSSTDISDISTDICDNSSDSTSDSTSDSSSGMGRHGRMDGGRVGGRDRGRALVRLYGLEGGRSTVRATCRHRGGHVLLVQLYSLNHYSLDSFFCVISRFSHILRLGWRLHHN